MTEIDLSYHDLRGAARPIIPPPTKANCGRHESDKQIAHAGPPLGETLRLLKPLALTLEKLYLDDNMFTDKGCATLVTVLKAGALPAITSLSFPREEGETISLDASEEASAAVDAALQQRLGHDA